MPEQSEWKLDVPAVEKPAPPKNRSIAIPQKMDFFEGVKALVPNHFGQRAVIGYTLERASMSHMPPSRFRNSKATRAERPIEGPQTRLVLCDLTLGRSKALQPVPGMMVPVALSDSGTEVLMRSDAFGFGKNDRLALWRLTASGITKLFECVPYEVDNGRDIRWAAFLSEDRFATLSTGGNLAVWNAATFQPIYCLKVDGGCMPALSPDRKYLAFALSDRVGMLDVSQGKVAALQSTPHLAWPLMCFSPDGARLACAAFDRLYVWNMADGSLHRNTPFAGQNLHGSDIVWLRDQYLLIGKVNVFDLENQVHLWTLQGHELAEKAGGTCAFVVTDPSGPGALLLANVPSPTFDQAMAKAMQAPDFFVLKEGTVVKLNVDGLPDPAEKEKALAALTKKLEEQGFQVGPQGTIELVATAEEGQAQDMTYRSFGFGRHFGSYTGKVRNFITRVKFVYQGKALWETQGGSVPGSVSMKEGETIEQVLRRSEKPNYSFFQSVALPKVLLKPMGEHGLGTSRVTTSGIQ